jgi:uncharacterized membrane protein YdjX (TVP38/TMEM64 family)
MERTIRIAVICLLICSIGAALCWLFFSRNGQIILNDPRQIGPHLTGWVELHYLHALIVFLGLYIVLTILFLPVWSLQMLSGYTLVHSLGIWRGLLLAAILCQIAATGSAMIAVTFSRWLAADWYHRKVEMKMHKLRHLDEKLGHNGFLLVMAVRLIHVMPFALSNYAFGLISVTLPDIVIGTLLGGIPGVLLYVVLGGHPRLVRDWRFSLAMVAINLVLIVPVALRYLKPQWFRKIGVE